jgi:predicted nuclease of restriction endonuclease-like (RecB) superfamily
MKKMTADYQKERSEFIKNPLIAEFLGVNQDAAVTESTLENAILNRLQKDRRREPDNWHNSLFRH